MTATTTDRFVPAPEAAFLAGLSDRQMQRAIDEHILEEPLVTREAGRRFANLGIAMAKFYFESESELTANARRLVISTITERLLKRSNWQDILALKSTAREKDWVVGLSTALIDLKGTVQSVKDRIDVLEDASRQIVCNPDILGGLPVFKGTRVPVDTVLAYLQSGASAQEIALDFDGIGEAQLEAARIWQQVHPRRGRPPVKVKPAGWKLVAKTSIPRKKPRATEVPRR
jgi:uncharacterized protein (DUF433 family)